MASLLFWRGFLFHFNILNYSLQRIHHLLLAGLRIWPIVMDEGVKLFRCQIPMKRFACFCTSENGVCFNHLLDHLFKFLLVYNSVLKKAKSGSACTQKIFRHTHTHTHTHTHMNYNQIYIKIELNIKPTEMASSIKQESNRDGQKQKRDSDSDTRAS